MSGSDSMKVLVSSGRRKVCWGFGGGFWYSGFGSFFYFRIVIFDFIVFELRRRVY